MSVCACVVNICLNYCPDHPVWTTTRLRVRNGDPKSRLPRPILVAACSAVREPTKVHHTNRTSTAILVVDCSAFREAYQVQRPEGTAMMIYKQDIMCS